jgi:acetoacetate decarboxylase
MPVHAPLFQNLSVYLRGARVALFQYVTDSEQAAELLPEVLELTDPPTAVLVLAEYPWTNIGPYNEAVQSLVCMYQSRMVQYITHIFVTTDAALALGREVWGYPKKIAHIDFVKENEVLAGYVERPRNFRICSGLMRAETPIDPATLPLLPTVCLRVIPGSAGPQSAELIEVGSDVRIKELWTGPGSCHFTGVSDLDPWHRIPVRQILSCAYGVVDFEITPGRILETL